MTKQQIRRAALSIWLMRQPAFIRRRREREARLRVEDRRIEIWLFCQTRLAWLDCEDVFDKFLNFIAAYRVLGHKVLSPAVVVPKAN